MNPTPRTWTVPTDHSATDLDDRRASASASRPRGPAERSPAHPRPDSLARTISSWLSERAINLAMVAGLLGVVGFVLGAGVAGYPALAAEEDIYLEQAWTLNHDALSHATSWYDSLPLGWIEVWLMANVTGPVLSGQSAVAQGQILMLALASAALLYVLARGSRLTDKQLAVSAC